MGVSVEFSGVTKRFASFTAVDDLSFSVAPGRITGFLGPNGAGKTTTLRILLGLMRATSGTATIDGRAYRDLDDPTGDRRCRPRGHQLPPRPVRVVTTCASSLPRPASRRPGSMRCWH